MSKTILVTGGAASGKSRWAVSYLAACDYVLYLRTADEVDKDTLGRIEYSNKHNFVEWDIKTGITSAPVETISDTSSLSSTTLRLILHTSSSRCVPTFRQ